MKTLGQIIASLSRHKPKDVKELLELCKFHLAHVGSGLYRDTYEIIGSGYVVKVPTSSKGDIEHSVIEFNAWYNIMHSSDTFAPLHPFMPHIPYFNANTGVLLMEKYDTSYRKRLVPLRPMIKRAKQTAKALMGYGSGSDLDLHSQNFGVDSHGALKIIDLGYFSEIGKTKIRKRRQAG